MRLGIKKWKITFLVGLRPWVQILKFKKIEGGVIELLWGANKTIPMICLAQCQAQSALECTLAVIITVHIYHTWLHVNSNTHSYCYHYIMNQITLQNLGLECRSNRWNPWWAGQWSVEWAEWWRWECLTKVGAPPEEWLPRTQLA